MNRFDRRVRRGAAYLDAQVLDRPWHRYVDWRNRIDLDRLDLDSSTNCIIGQLTRNFYSSLESYESDFWLIRHGFVVPGDIPGTPLLFAGYGGNIRVKRRELRLRAAWRDYITSEREVKTRAQVG